MKFSNLDNQNEILNNWPREKMQHEDIDASKALCN